MTASIGTFAASGRDGTAPAQFGARVPTTKLGPVPDAALRLLCLPYAGGSSAIFRVWPGQLAPDIEVWVAELPGRGRQLATPPIANVRELAAAIVDGASELLRSGPFAIFGHSMGAIVAFEVACELRRRRLPGPRHLFVSCASAPHRFSPARRIHALPTAELVAELGELGGTPPEVLRCRELMELVLPAIRADFKACAGYRYRLDAPLVCPITAFGADDDPLAPVADVLEWSRHTTARFRSETFRGGHFFLQSGVRDMLASLAASAAGRSERSCINASLS